MPHRLILLAVLWCGCSRGAPSAVLPADLASAPTAADLASAPSCSDGVKDQDETGVDCGGASCSPCADGEPCLTDTDCASGTCGGGSCQHPPVSLTFAKVVAYPAGGAVSHIAVGDFDGDALPDVLALDANQASYRLLRGRQDGTLAAPTAPVTVGDPPLLALAAGDLDGDGIADLAAGALGRRAYLVLSRRPGGTSLAWSEPVGGLAVGDFNGDGKRDLAVIGLQGSYLVGVFPGDGAGGFAPAQTSAIGAGGPSITAGDLDGDGRDDLVIAGGDVSIQVLPGAARLPLAVGYRYTGMLVWYFTPEVGRFGPGGTAGIVATTSTDGRQLLLADGHGGYVPGPVSQTACPPTAVTVVDLDRDGIDEAAFVCGAGIDVVRSDGTGALQAGPVAYAPGVADVAHADLDRDGWPDLIAGGGTQVVVFRNTSH